MKIVLVAVMLAFGTLPAFAAETVVVVDHDKDTFTDNQNVALILAQQKDVLTAHSIAAICQIDKVAVTVNFGPQFIMEDFAPIQYRIDSDAPATENWRWNGEGQILYKFDTALVQRLGRASKFAIRFADQVTVFDFSSEGEKVKEFSDTCARILEDNAED